MLRKITDCIVCLFSVSYAPFPIRKRMEIVTGIIDALIKKKTTISYGNSPFTVDRPISFLILLLYWQEIYVLRSCCRLPVAPVIVDIGANIGQWGRHFNFFYPKARIFSFEPNKTVGAILKRNAKLIPGWRVFLLGIGTSIKTSLYVPKEGSAEGTLIRPNNGDYETVPIQCIPLTKEHCKKLGIPLSVDLVKIDVEGFEEQILVNTKTIRTNYVEIEIDFSPQSERTIHHVKQWINKYWHASSTLLSVQKAHAFSKIGNAFFEIRYEE